MKTRELSRDNIIRKIKIIELENSEVIEKAEKALKNIIDIYGIDKLNKSNVEFILDLAWASKWKPQTKKTQCLIEFESLFKTNKKVLKKYYKLFRKWMLSPECHGKEFQILQSEHSNR